MTLIQFIQQLEKKFAQSTVGLMGIFLVLGIVFILYLPSLFFDFLVLSDQKLLMQNFEAELTPFLHYSNSFTYLSFVCNAKLTGFSAFALHSTNLILHLINLILIYKFTHRFLRLRKRRHGRSAENRITALFVAFFWGIHPLNSEAVTWISARQSLIFAFIFLVFLSLWIQYLRSKDILIYGLVILVSIILFFEQPTAVILLPTLILMDWFLNRKYRRKTKRILEKIPFLILTIYTFIRYLSASHGIRQIQESLQITIEQNVFFSITDFQIFNQIILGCYALGNYLVKIILPIFLTHYYPFPVFPNENISPEYQFFILLVIMLLFSYTYLARYKQKEMIFGLSFFIIHTIPFLPIYPFSGKVMQDSYVYLGSYGMILMLTVFIEKIILKKDNLKIILTFSILILGILYSVRTVSLHIYRYDEFSLRNHTVALYSDSEEARYQRLQIYLHEGQKKQALDDLNFILEKRSVSSLYLLRGEILEEQGKVEKACQDYQSAEALMPHIARQKIEEICPQEEE